MTSVSNPALLRDFFILFSMKVSKRTYLITGSLLFIVPVIIYGLWIYAVNQVPTHEARVEIYHSYFPSFLQGRFDTTYLSIVFLIGSVVCFFKAIENTTGWFKAVTMTLLIMASLLLFLNLFSMM